MGNTRYMHMNRKMGPAQAPMLGYSTLVGRTLASQRQIRNMRQEDVAAAIGASQSAYSRMEAGETPITVAQLRMAAGHLGLSVSQVMNAVDDYEQQLTAQGVMIVGDRPNNAAAVALGLGFLGALLLASKA